MKKYSVIINFDVRGLSEAPPGAPWLLFCRLRSPCRRPLSAEGVYCYVFDEQHLDLRVSHRALLPFQELSPSLRGAPVLQETTSTVAWS